MFVIIIPGLTLVHMIIHYMTMDIPKKYGDYTPEEYSDDDCYDPDDYYLSDHYDYNYYDEDLSIDYGY